MTDEDSRHQSGRNEGQTLDDKKVIDEEGYFYDTGIEALNLQFGGVGFNSPTIVTVTTPPEGLGRQYLYQFVSGEPDIPTYYLSFGERKAIIEEGINIAGGNIQNVQVIDTIRENYATEALETLREIRNNEIGKMSSTNGEESSAVKDNQSIIVVDPTNFLERSPAEEYRDFLFDLKSYLRQTNSIAYFLAIEDDPEAPHRWLTMSNSGTIFKLVQEVDTNNVEKRMAIEKVSPAAQMRSSFRSLFEQEEGKKGEIDLKPVQLMEY